jgi:hypothetical protein
MATTGLTLAAKADHQRADLDQTGRVGFKDATKAS